MVYYDLQFSVNLIRTPRLQTYMDIVSELENSIKPIRILYVSTYIPRKCGIATFTKDLTNAVNLINPLSLAKIAAMDNNISEKLDYPHEVAFRIPEGKWSVYKRVVDYINKSGDFDMISLQHEYGIFGGVEGELIMSFIEGLKKPLVTTLHTVLSNPNPLQKKIIQKISTKSESLVVMLDSVADILVDKYQVERSKIVVIHHGVPDFAKLEPGYLKRKLNLSKYVVMSSCNLIAPSKGLEYAIGAIPEIVKAIPNFLYLIVGATHPVYLGAMGVDLYRRGLKKLVKNLGVERYVRFCNKYVTLSQLVQYIGASDFYITPYLGPEQAASGALAYAIGAGKACISTPYLYAKEMLADGRGVIVSFGDSGAISRAVIRLNKKPEEKMGAEVKAYALGRTMTWINIAHQYFHVFNYVTRTS